MKESSSDSGGWEVFQRDVLDVLRQYEGYFDFFERVGSLSDSRPDCFARVTRDDKKEIWIVDAKGKSEVNSEDLRRMEKYVDMVRNNPVDVGLELSELAEHEVRGVFVTEKEGSPEGFEQVAFSGLHQFLQAELVYTDTDRVVRDVAKMVEKKQLSQSQARLLFKSIEPFQKRLREGADVLEELETEFVGLEVDKPPLSSYDYDIPVDAVVEHGERDQVFLLDIPYSERAADNVEEKVEEIKSRMEDIDRPVYYAAINTFSERDSEYLIQPGELKKEVMETAGIVSPEDLIELFTPKIPVEKEYGDSYIEVRDNIGIGFRTRVETVDDVKHRIEAVLPDDAISSLSDQLLNTRKIGEIQGNRFQEKIEVSEDLIIRHSQGEEPLESFKELVNSLYQSSVNPVLGRKVSSTI